MINEYDRQTTSSKIEHSLLVQSQFAIIGDLSLAFQYGLA